MGLMMTMMGVGTLVSQPSINEGISRVISPVMDPVVYDILPVVTDPLSKLMDPAGKLLGDALYYATPVGILSDVISLAFDKPEPIWTPDEETSGMIDDATKDRIAMAMEWELFGEKALQPWHGLEAFQALELEMYGRLDDSEELPSAMYADADYKDDEVSDAQSRKEEFIDEQAQQIVEEYKTDIS